LRSILLHSRNRMPRAVRQDSASPAATSCPAAIGRLMPHNWRCASCAPLSCSAATWPQQQGRRSRSPTRPTPGPSSIGCRTPFAEGRASSAAIRCPPLLAVFCRSTGDAHLAHLLAQRLPGRNRSAGAAQSWPIDPVRERPWALRTGGGSQISLPRSSLPRSLARSIDRSLAQSLGPMNGRGRPRGGQQ